MAKSDRRNALPKRSKQFGVGKDIGGNIYVHRQYESVLGEAVQTAKKLVPSDFQYTIIKLNLSTQGVTFVVSPDFDEADEPIVGRFILVREDGTTLERNQLDDPYIYHHKWLMVKDDYSGFDAAESKRRSALWLSLKDVDKSRIGRKGYWDSQVVPRIIAIAATKTTNATEGLPEPD